MSAHNGEQEPITLQHLYSLVQRQQTVILRLEKSRLSQEDRIRDLEACILSNGNKRLSRDGEDDDEEEYDSDKRIYQLSEDVDGKMYYSSEGDASARNDFNEFFDDGENDEIPKPKKLSRADTQEIRRVKYERQQQKREVIVIDDDDNAPNSRRQLVSEEEHIIALPSPSALDMCLPFYSFGPGVPTPGFEKSF